uniref:BLOC-1-related complex subunit 5 n=1 Tax=Elaeophora elaphi TaxID=1147741 RepID=A0A0R3RT76_9BILA
MGATVLFMIAVSGKMCAVCGRSPFTYESVGHHMSEKTKNYFQTPDTLLANALRKVDSVIKFQQNQYNIMREKVSSMHGQVNNVADRYKETAKMCNFLERNAVSLMTNMQNHHGILRQLNSSFANCTQSLKYFGDVSENADTSEKNFLQVILPDIKISFKIYYFRLHLQQTSSTFNTAVSEPFIHCSDISKDLSMSCLKSVKTSGNLVAVFGSKERSKAKKLTNSNPYMRYMLQKNARSLADINRNVTRSAAAQIKKDGFNVQQLGSKRRPKVSENIQLSESVCKMESNTHGLFTVRRHSRSRSPPRKSTRPGDN